MERTSDRELVVTRTFDAPARLVFEAWSRPELMKQWWVPKSLGMTLRSIEVDCRTGRTLPPQLRRRFFILDFFGRYLEVTPPSRIVWTNEESGDAGSVTTVTFEEKDGKTLLVLHELYPSKEAFEAGSGAADAMDEQFKQLDELLVTLGASVGRSYRARLIARPGRWPAPGPASAGPLRPRSAEPGLRESRHEWARMRVCPVR